MEERKKYVKANLEKKILPKIFNTVTEVVLNVDFKDKSTIGSDHFTSYNHFVVLTLKCKKTGTFRTLQLMVKTASQNDEFRRHAFTDNQFFNESVMYNTVIPSFIEFENISSPNSIKELVPKHFCAECDISRGRDAIVILENLKVLNYKPFDSPDLDYEHCVLAVKALAKFHSFSYAMKVKDSKEFEGIKFWLKEVRYSNEDEELARNLDLFHQHSTLYFIDYLINSDYKKIPLDYLLKMKNKFSNCLKYIQKLLTPSEPFSVICHGDYLRNNLFFKYEDNKPVHVKMFDFQTSRYASPCIDLSLLMFMSVSPEIRKLHLDNFLKLYHDEVLDNTSNLLNKPIHEINQIYSWDEFMADFVQHVDYAYVICSFFVPVIMKEGPFGPSGDFETDFIESAKDPTHVIGHINDRSRSRMIDMLTEYYERGYNV